MENQEKELEIVFRIKDEKLKDQLHCIFQSAIDPQMASLERYLERYTELRLIFIQKNLESVVIFLSRLFDAFLDLALFTEEIKELKTKMLYQLLVQVPNIIQVEWFCESGKNNPNPVLAID